MSPVHSDTSPLCTVCRSTLVQVMTIDDAVTFWSCINCGHVWGTPQKAGEPVLSLNARRDGSDAGISHAHAFDDHVRQLRGALEDASGQLDRVAPQLERIPACVLIVNNIGRYIAVNDLACALAGYSRTELLRKTISDLTAPNEIVRYERLWDSFIGSTKQHGVYNILRKDGTLVKVEYVAYTDLAPGIHISVIRTSV